MVAIWGFPTLVRDSSQLAEEAAHALRLALRDLVDERELLEILQRLDVLRLQTCFIPCSLIIRRILVGVLDDLLQLFELELLQFLARHCLDCLVPVFSFNPVFRAHNSLPP